jgi:hypothetical protein
VSRPSVCDADPVTYDDKVWPVTIVRSRYGGIYEPGEWVALACMPADLPLEWDADDVTCASFYEDRRDEIGGGSNPQEAYVDLVRLI